MWLRGGGIRGLGRVSARGSGARTAVGARKAHLEVVPDEHGMTGRLQKDDRCVVHVVCKKGKVVPAQTGCFVEVAVAEGGPATAFAALWYNHPKSSRLQDLHRG